MPIRNDTDALVAARRLETYLLDAGHVRASQAMREVVDVLVARVHTVTRTLAAINGSALVAAVVLSFPFLDDAQVSRRTGVPSTRVTGDRNVAAIRRLVD